MGHDNGITCWLTKPYVHECKYHIIIRMPRRVPELFYPSKNGQTANALRILPSGFREISAHLILAPGREHHFLDVPSPSHPAYHDISPRPMDSFTSRHSMNSDSLGPRPIPLMRSANRPRLVPLRVQSRSQTGAAEFLCYSDI